MVFVSFLFFFWFRKTKVCMCVDSLLRICLWVSVCSFAKKGWIWVVRVANLHLFYVFFTHATRTQLGDIIPSPCFVFFFRFFFFEKTNHDQKKRENKKLLPLSLSLSFSCLSIFQKKAFLFSLKRGKQEKTWPILLPSSKKKTILFRKNIIRIFFFDNVKLLQPEKTHKWN